MINLRYHIVSITAVFLALGIGLAFGAAFIDRATVDALNRNLTEIEEQNRELERINDQLARQVLDDATREAALIEQGLPQVVDGRLDQVPLFVLVSEGIDDAVTDAISTAAIDAGGQLAAVVTVTDRFALDDDSELEDLRAVLGLPGAGAEQLRTATIRRLRTILTEASRPPSDDDASGSVIDPPPVPVPELFQALADAGFLEIEPTDAPPPGFALIPERGLRTVVVSGPDGAVAEDGLVLPLVQSLATPLPTDPDAPPPIQVAVQPSVPPVLDEDAPEPGFVGILRANEAVQGRLSTVDHVESFAGLLAAILSAQYAGEGQLGHYGTDDGATALVPPVPAIPGTDD
jgi:Copper transport outer membrane protein, MctB